ncbi:MAG: hypothetical protein V1932_06745 [Chloroflexota bacterium]
MIKWLRLKMAGTLLAITSIALIVAIVALVAGCSHDPRSIRIDNVGARGFDSPQELTDSQKQKVVDIILNSPEAKEKPPTESIYNTSLFWTAFIWDDTGYSYQSSVRFESWEDDPTYKDIPESVRWYPGATLYYGDPQAPTAEWLIQANVDLNAEKVVYINSMPYHATPLTPPAPSEQPPPEQVQSHLPDSTKEPYPGNHGITTTKIEPKPGESGVSVSGLMIRLTLDDLIEKSDAVVIGKVVDIFPSRQVDWEPWDKMIITDVVIEVEHYLYGQSQSPYIAVMVRGGRVGDMGMWVEDEPVFNLGEEVVLFLYQMEAGIAPPEGFDHAGYFRVTGSMQGKLGYRDGHAINLGGESFTLSEIERKIASMHGGK